MDKHIERQSADIKRYWIEKEKRKTREIRTEK